MNIVNSFFPQKVEKSQAVCSVFSKQKCVDKTKAVCYNNAIHPIKGVVFILRIWWADRSSREMAGTKAGGMKAAATNKAKYGKEFYARIGKKGGENGHTGGFAANPALARIAGAKGGRISRRGPAKKEA